MKNISTYIQETLTTLYPPEEIRGIIRLILSHVCGLSYNQQILCKDKQISEKEKVEINTIVNRLKKMEPLQYILGETEFYSLPIKVNPSVLIPRPETEELVDMILKTVMRNHNMTQKPFPRIKTCQPLRILDIGTGSGCIAISLAKHITDADVIAVDISEDALKTAKMNALLNNIDISFIHVDILNIPTSSELNSGYFDIIVSNPPYITNIEKNMMSENVIDYEPHCALFVPDDAPLLFYDAIAGFALKKLSSEGMLYFEINANYDIEINEMLHDKGFFHTEIIRDLSGKNRFISAGNIGEQLVDNGI